MSPAVSSSGEPDKLTGSSERSERIRNSGILVLSDLSELPVNHSWGV